MASIELVPTRDLDYDAFAAFRAGELGASTDFRRSQTPDYYRWLTSPSPHGEAVSFVALDRSARIAGTLTAVMRRMVVEGESLLGAKLEEMKTDPEFRGRGVMTSLFDRVKEEVLRRGAVVLMGGPTSPDSYPIFRQRFGFSAPFELQTSLRIVARTRSPRVSESGEEPDEQTIGRASELAREVSTSSRVAVLRDAAYLDWRYRRHPDAYRFLVWSDSRVVRGVAVLKETVQRGIRILNVVELLGRTPSERASMMRRVCAFARRGTRARMVAVWPPTPADARALLLRAFFPRPAKTRFVAWLREDLKPEVRAALLTRSAWYVGMGDFFDI